MNKKDVQEAFRINMLCVSAFNLGWALRDVTVGAALAIFTGLLAIWVQATFKPKPSAPEPSLCDCGGGREGPHRGDCRLIRYWENLERGRK